MKLFFLTAFVVVVFLSLFATLSKAEIRYAKIVNDERQMIRFERFGFTHSGTVIVQISSLGFSSGNASRFGFFLEEETKARVLVSEEEKEENPNSCCVLDSESISLIVSFQDLLSRWVNHRIFVESYAVTRPGTYVLCFGDCNPGGFVTMNLRMEMFNVDEAGNRVYLSVGLTPMPYVYLCFFILYVCSVLYWMWLCYRDGYFSVHILHVLMGAVLLLKAITMLCAALESRGLTMGMVDEEGGPSQWGFLFIVFQVLWVTTVFIVTAKIANGEWTTFLKPFLDERLLKKLMRVVTFQIFAVIASTVLVLPDDDDTYSIIDEMGIIKDWVWLIFLMLDITCFVLIVISHKLWVSSLRESSNNGDKVAQKLSKANGFIKFYALVFTRIYFIKLVFFFLKSIQSYKYQWVALAAQQTATLAIHFGSIYMFKLIENKKNQTLVVFEEIHPGSFYMFGLTEKKTTIKSLVCEESPDGGSGG